MLTLGTDHLGEPRATMRSTIESISDPERLEELARRIHKVADWDELLNGD